MIGWRLGCQASSRMCSLARFIRCHVSWGAKGELVGADLVLAATRLAFGQTHWLGLDLPGAAFALVGGDLAGGAAGICRTRLGGVLLRQDLGVVGAPGSQAVQDCKMCAATIGWCPAAQLVRV